MHSQTFKEIKQLEALIKEGNELFQSPKSNNVLKASGNSGLAIPISTLIDNWIKKSVTFINYLLPDTIITSDLNMIKEMPLNKDGNVILSNPNDMPVILDALKMCLAFFRWLVNFDDNILNNQQKANFHFGPLEAIANYLHENLNPKLKGLEDGRTKKTAMLHLYGRIFLLAFGLVKLNEMRYCQILGASLRSLLELYIDFFLISHELIDNSIEKFFMFDMAHHYRSAKELLDIDKELGRPAKESSALKKYLIDGDQKEVIIHTIWGTKKVSHWSGLTVKDRARKAELLDIYRDIYYYGNMFVHSGYIGYPNTEEDAHLICAHVYALSAKMLKDTSLLISDESNIEQKNEIKKQVEDLYFIFGYFNVWKSWVNSRK